MDTKIVIQKTICKILIVLSIGLAIMSILTPITVSILKKHNTSEPGKYMWAPVGTESFVIIFIFSILAAACFIIELKEFSEYAQSKYFAIRGALVLIILYFFLNPTLYFILDDTKRNYYPSILFILFLVLPITHIILSYLIGNNKDAYNNNDNNES